VPPESSCSAGLQRADGLLTLAQELEQPHARRVAERAEEVRLERVDGRLAGAVRQFSSNLTNFEDRQR
jgi:hypothetical protein